MIVRHDGEMASDSSLRETSTSSESESHSDDSYIEGDLLTVKRFMCSQMLDEAETQRENIFHSRCHVFGTLCSIIIYEVEVAFTLGTYKDKVLYDVVPMEATHLFLGRPCQFDRKVIRDGVTKRFTFVHMGQKVVLKPLSPRVI
ncbi:hypothetical protein CR513_22558, partial [Mucuna pruriens]